MTYTCLIDSPIGEMRASAQHDALIGLWFVGQKYYPTQLDNRIDSPNYHVFTKLRSWLSDYFAGRNPAQTIPLSPDGTDFQRSVWDILIKIPYGHTVTYGDIAKQLGSSSRAVGGAVGHNPISLVIPCHRVMGANGAITGFAGGCDKKIALLNLEHNLEV